MEGLLQLCRHHGVDVHFVRLSSTGKILGYYCHARDGTPLIMLDESLCTRPRLLRCVLAEELGHHLTVPQGHPAGMGYSVLERDNLMQLSLDEARALRWAANCLIPTDELAFAAKRGLVLAHELAEHFQVEEWMVWRKFHVLRQDLREQHRLRASFGDILSPLLAEIMWGAAV